jgi:hypothetical protein
VVKFRETFAELLSSKRAAMRELFPTRKGRVLPVSD